MKAVLQHRYGSADVLQLEEVDMPVAGDNEVLVRVRAAAINAFDWHVMRGDPYIYRLMSRLGGPKDKVRGRDLAGRVEAVGRNVTQFQRGDEVYGEVHGSLAEYVAVPAELLVLKPANLTFEQAAAVPLAAQTALLGIRDRGELKPGQTVLINGAAGGVGTFAVQLAVSFGAHVTAVCSARNAEMVRSLGAHEVIDYAQTDFTRTGWRYDLIFDLVANRSLTDCRRALTPQGTLVLAGGNGGRWIGALSLMVRGALLSPFVSQRLRPLAVPDPLERPRNQENLILLRRLIESGEVTPVIDRTYPLAEAPDAISYVASKHARAKVVVTL